MKGTLESFSLEEILQAVNQSKKFGRIDIQGAHGQYGIYINKDNIYHAFSPHYERGINAVLEAFIETKGTFEFKEMLNSKFITISKPFFDVITEGIALKEELASLNSEISDDTTFDLVQEANFENISLSGSDLKFLRDLGKGLPVSSVLKEENIDYITFLRKLKSFIDIKLVKIKKAGQ
ncbi:DUF4388 domain-containing protein [Caldisericum exile]|uniref:PatA-like N-terminal domain-containing protein n=1 Tax=Caldisericum exile (strain DSM 21853 / NBRC 104410 / AZM16c01) TaxID=511051 RepID=A0A7U6GDC2_CALEA|nr:DUF4388 domain-containing protein [Caldisericum exile]BAL80323.1 hypothetical protein CSE_01970 [Caldisericum exile AZM16c01]